MSGSKLAVAALLLASLSSAALAGDKKPASYATVAGTVFRDPGLALADAKVVLQLKDQPKSKKLAAVTNYRGEFAFHVPAKAAVYVIKASMKGYRPEQKEATISSEEHIDVNLVLSPEPK